MELKNKYTAQKEIYPFVYSNNINQLFEQNLLLIDSIFNFNHIVNISLANDYENNDTWIEINIPVEDDIDSFFKKYDNYCIELIKIISVNNRLLIRLSFYVPSY